MAAGSVSDRHGWADRRGKLPATDESRSDMRGDAAAGVIGTPRITGGGHRWMTEDDREIWVGAALATVLVGILLLRVGDRPVQVRLCWLALAALHAASVLLALPQLQVDAARGRRRLWRGVLVTAAIYLVGDLAQLVEVAMHPRSLAAATGSLPQFLSVAFGTPIFVGCLLLLPTHAPGYRPRLRNGLDIATVMMTAATFGWWVSRGSRIPPFPGAHDLLGWAVGVGVGPVTFLVGGYAVARLLMSEQAPFSPVGGALLAFAAITEALAQAFAPTLETASRMPWLLAVTVAANTCFMLFVAVERCYAAGPNRTVARFARGAWLPYGAVAATCLLLVHALLGARLEARGWVVVAGLIVCTGLVAGRQLTTLRDNQRLLTHLERALAERDELTRRLQHRADHDELTGIANRAYLLNRLRLIPTHPTSGCVVLLFFDLDGFKPINDGYGHAAGDEVLCVVARRLAAGLHDSDVAARLGGDEFALLVARPDYEAALADARALAHAVAEPIWLSAGAKVTVTASVGAVQVRDEDVADLLRKADVAMYKSKRDGRNRVTLWDKHLAVPCRSAAQSPEQRNQPSATTAGSSPDILVH